MITCGRPAVPIISDKVYANIFKVPPILAVVYSLKPKSVTTKSSLSNRYTPLPSAKVEPRPNCGIGLPVNWNEINIPGMVYAVINTIYWAICVYVIPFIPPNTA